VVKEVVDFVGSNSRHEIGSKGMVYRYHLAWADSGEKEEVVIP
jgi:hypothetical protein